MKYKRIINITIILLILFEILLSAYLIYEDNKKVSNICMIGNNCESVRDSSYGQIWGIKLPYYALFAFIILLLCYPFYKRIFFIGTVIGGLAALYLIIIQLFILKQICSLCMIVDITMILLLSLAIANRYLK